MKALLVLILLPFAIVWEAWVLQQLWRWFVVPLGFPLIGKAHLYGLSILLGLMRYRPASRDKRPPERVFGDFVGATAMALLMGYITHWLMGGS